MSSQLSRAARGPLRVLIGLGVAAALCFLFAPVAQADPITGVALQSMNDGTSPFDASAGPGNDTDASNGEVRSYDKVTYAWAVNVNSSTGSSETFDRVEFTQTLPAELSWQSADVPSYCKGTGWNITGQTLTCVYVPPGGTGTTGTTLNFSLTALAGGEIDGTVATPAADSASVTVSSGATTSAASTATPPPVTIRSAPFLDMFKSVPAGSVAPSGNPLGDGYFLDYPIGIRVPAGPRELRGFLMPSAPVTFTDDLSEISPAAQFVSCSGAASCVPGAGQDVDVTFASLPTNPASNGSLANGTLRVFVPKADVDADADGNLNTVNHLVNLVASAPAAGGGTVASSGDRLDNNDASYNLVTTGGSGNINVNKRFLDANGVRLPTQMADNDGNGQVLDTQTLISQFSVGNGSSTAPAPTPAVCDVWDATRLHLSGDGPGPAAHGGAPVWAQSLPSGWTAGVDYVIEYGTQAAATGDDATRWAALRSRSACDDASDTWTTTLPADLSTVTKIRVRLLRDIPPAGGTLTFRANLQVDDPTDGDLVANFLGRRVGTTWTASGYQPATNGSGAGDRVRVNGITVRIRKRSSNPSVSFGSPATISSGGAVQFELTPTVTALDIGTGAPVAHNVVIRDRLPLGLTFDSTRPVTPGGLTPVLTTDGTGRQILTWTIPTLTKGSEPTISYWVQSASTAIGDRLNEVVIDSDEDVGGLETIPTGSISESEQHYAKQTVTLQSPGGVRISKAALQTVVEPLDPLAFRIEYANLTASTATNVDIIDVLPYVGDGVTMGAIPGRNPSSTRHGTLPIDSVDLLAGETIRYTNADANAVYASSNPATTVDANYGALPAGKSWCTQAQFGTAGCPTGLDDVTALRVGRAALASGDSGTITLHFAPLGNRSGDVYSNTAAIRYGSGNLGALSNVATSRVVASTIGDYVWYDENANGIQDAGEEPVVDEPVTLTGTDKHGRSISVTTRTDSTGKYRFTGASQAAQNAGVVDLVSGAYTVTFRRPDGYRFTTQHAGGSTTANDSDADPSTGAVSVTVPDPSPTGADGQNLTIDAGLVKVPSAAPKKDDPQPEDPTSPGDPGGGGGAPATTPGGSTGAGASGGKDRPRLAVTKRATRKAVVAGRSVTWVIAVRNRGQADAHGVVACDTPGRGLTVQRVPQGARFDAGRLCWRLGMLKAGAQRTLRVTTPTVPAAADRRVRNVVRVTAKGVRTRSAQASVLVRGGDGGVGDVGVHAGVTG